MPALCRDCLTTFDAGRRCPACGGPRVVAHPELFDLNIAHMDCDAFYAAVEKRDNPALRDKPVIIGGGRRGVVSTACYIARIKGVRSAMPMFKALALCPEAVVVRGRMDAYVEVSRQVRALMEELPPAIEPLSLDEAFLDLSGTARLHGAPPAVLLARLTRQMEAELGISGSIGLSHNKFLAKVASDLDKPRGFSIIGAEETPRFLNDKPVSLIWGVGTATRTALDKAGIRRPYLAPVGKARRQAQGQGHRRADRYPEAQAIEPHDPDTKNQPNRSHPDRRPDLQNRTRDVRPGRRQRPLPPAGRGRQRHRPGQRGRYLWRFARSWRRDTGQGGTCRRQHSR